MSSDALTKRNTTFKGDVLRLVSGTGLAQVITLLAAPILTRLYAPEAFGVAALFASITGIMGVLACMRYELAIVLPDNDREAANLLAVSVVMTVIMAGLTIPVIGYGSDQILAWVNMPEMAPYLWLIPLAVLANGFFMALNYWNTRTKHFTRLSITRVTSQVAATGSSLGLGLAGYASGGSLIAASLGGQAVATTVLGGQIWRDNGRYIFSSVTWREMCTGVKRHKKFPLYSTWGALINTASWQLPILLLGAFFSPAIVGFYSLGFRILQMPMGLIGGSIAQAFLQRAPEARKDGEIGTLVIRLLEKLLIACLVPMLLLAIIGEDVYIVFFGERWAEAGVYTQILSIWAALWFISSPLSSVVVVFEKMEKELALSSLSFVLRIAAIAIGGLLQEPRLGLALFAFAGLISYGYLLRTIFSLCEIEIADIKSSFYRITSGAAWPVIIVLTLKFINSSSFTLVLAGTFVTLGYFIFNKKYLSI